MAWQMVKVAQLPLGGRILRFGCAGDDVVELQKMLTQAGFYFGPVDGYYGVLTESAVTLAERTFRLRTDGIVGKRVIEMLQGLSGKMGRTVYTVKDHENLERISQKFGVTPNAWEAIAGQGNPREKIFPGMKLILYEKAVFTWDEKPAAKGAMVTGRMVNGGVVNSQGHLEISKEITPDSLVVISSDAGVWDDVVTFRSKRNRLLAELRTLPYPKVGLDLRTIKPELAGYWKSFLKVAGRQRNRSSVLVVIAPLYLTSHDLWRSHHLLQWIASCEGINWLMVEAQPSLELSSHFGEKSLLAGNFEEQLKQYNKGLAELNRQTMHKILPVISTDAWQPVDGRKVSYKEARIIRAINYRTAQYLPEIQLTRVSYLRHGEEQCLYYRDYHGWSDLFYTIKKQHFVGLVIRNPEMPDIALPDMIADAFTILPERKLLEMTANS